MHFLEDLPMPEIIVFPTKAFFPTSRIKNDCRIRRVINYSQDFQVFRIGQSSFRLYRLSKNFKSFGIRGSKNGPQNEPL